LAELHSLLQGYAKGLAVENSAETSDVKNSLKQPEGWKSTIARATLACIALFTFTKVPGTLPQHRQDEQEVITTGACTSTGIGGDVTHDSLLLCIPFMRYGKLYQPEICRINSDREILDLLRRYYNTKRGRSSWRLLRKVKSINFVKELSSKTPDEQIEFPLLIFYLQFEMYRSHLADVHLCPLVRVEVETLHPTRVLFMTLLN
jgi:hypothetical protein